MAFTRNPAAAARAGPAVTGVPVTWLAPSTLVLA
jgi:hypothetical protein